MQMDKVGHVISAYQASKWVYGAMRWSGMKNKNAALFGMGVGTAFQATIEILDGFSSEWKRLDQVGGEGYYKGDGSRFCQFC